MTRQRSFKRLVRARMEKTGESYTAARASLLAADAPRTSEAPVLATSDETIRRRTGLGWEEWFDLLDEWGAAERTHREIARWVAERLGIEPLVWEAQAVTLSYERARGGRAVGEHADGFTITASKTVAVPPRAAVRRVHRRGTARALAARRVAARAHLDETEVRPLRLGGRPHAGQREASRPRARRRAPSRSSTRDSPTPARPSG